MESVPMAERYFVLHLKVTGNHGSFYFSIPKEYASLHGLKPGDIGEVTIWSCGPPKEERKK